MRGQIHLVSAAVADEHLSISRKGLDRVLRPHGLAADADCRRKKS